MNHPTDTRYRALARGLGASLSALFGVTALLLISWFGSAAAGSDPTIAAFAPMIEVSPGGVVAPHSVPEAIAVHYRAAHAHAETFAAVPCYCGCAEMLDHRSLLDCFQRPDGEGWEAHALGCGVCIGEAAQVQELIAAGLPDGDIERAVTLEWGDPYSIDR